MGLMPKMGETRLNIFQQLATKKPVCVGLDELLGYKKQQLYPLWLAIKIIGKQREGKGNGRTDEDVSRNLARKYAPWRIGNIFHRHTDRARGREVGGQSIWTCSLWARTQHFSEYVCLMPEIGHGDKSLNVTVISGRDWF